MSRKPYPSAVKLDLTDADQTSHRSGEGRRRKTGIELKAQLFHSDAWQIRVAAMKALQDFAQDALEPSPTHRRDHKRRLPDGNRGKAETIDQACDLAGAEGTIACEGSKIQIAGRRVEQRSDGLFRCRNGECFEHGQPIR
ncbi:hypothetical protein [Mesorhizobium sp.]|uniref:hypothetical protein n=1 Tax=Mesorhizobium sp. TaxID=1871066 RepID=UPI0025C5C965|nr:hypothetical protein [Mesorhizobium sp.]